MRKGWFKLPGQDGDRTLAQQLLGLDRAFLAAKGESVLDLGCAEGLIALEAMKRGADSADCVEIVPGNAVAAQKQLAGLNARVWQMDVVEFARRYYGGRWHVTLALAILHKLRDPTTVIDLIGRATDHMAVIRLPASTPGFIRDRRSGFVTFHLAPPLEEHGLHLQHVERGPFDEWMGYFIRA